jgi:hypothetical protein
VDEQSPVSHDEWSSQLTVICFYSFCCCVIDFPFETRPEDDATQATPCGSGGTTL